MKILVLNCGSSSLKYQLIDMSNEEVLCVVLKVYHIPIFLDSSVGRANGC